MTGSGLRSDARPLLRIRFAGLIAASIVALLLVNAGDRLSRPLFDTWQRMSPRDMSDTRVHVVIIDPASIAALGAWPWPRYHLARLVDRIAAGGASVIGFDMLFPEPDRVTPALFAALYPELSAATADEIGALTSTDQAFSDVIGRNPVVLARAGIAGGGADPAGLSIEARLTGAPSSALAAYPRAIANIFELESVAIGHGLINGTPDADAVIRSVPLVARVGERPMPGLDAELARIAAGADGLAIDRHSLRIGTRSLPIGEDGHMLLRFGDFPATAVSLAGDVMQRNGPEHPFAGKAVLIGLAAEGTADVVATPMASEGYGVFVHAQVLDAILRGSGWLSRPHAAIVAEWAIGALLALIVIFLLPRHGRGRWLLLLAPLAIGGAGWLLFDAAAILFDPLKPLLLGGGSAIGVAAAMFAQARVDRERLRETLVGERVTAAAIEAELDTARAIQIGMLPTAKTLASLDPRVEVSAKLEAARAVGGDFYDAVKADEGRILFCIADVTGKGVPASLFMAVSKSLAKSVILREPDLAAAAAMLNAELSRDNADTMGVTMVLGTIALATGEVALVNAGHENPLRLTPDGTVEEIRLEGGPPFCIVDYPWPVERLRLSPGETLLLITDGVTEAQDRAGALFGTGRLNAVLHAAPASPAGIVDHIFDAVRRFEDGTEASDDVTIFALRYLGAESRRPSASEP